MTDWAAKVLEGVARLDTDPNDYASLIPTKDGSLVSYDAALAAIARMGAGDGLVEQLLARKGRYGAFKLTVEDGVNVLTHEPVPDPLCQEAAARIVALTAQVAAEERAVEQVIDERHQAQEWADKLAHAIGGDAVGEHSNMNNPWQNALEIAEAAEAERDALTAQNREMALDVLASSGQAADAYAAQLAAEAERDALRAQMAENRISEPHDPGDFVGDIFYGHPIKTTMGTHRWTGTEWVALPSEAEALAGLLAGARKEAAALRERVARLEGAMRWIIENNDEGNGLYSRDGLYAKRARAALTDGGTEYERKVAQMKKDFPNGI